MRPLRIGVNALYLIPGGVGGTEIYLRGVLDAMAAIDRSNEYFVFRNHETGADLTPAQSNFHDCPQPVKAAFRPARMIYEQAILPFAVQARRIDVLFNGGFTAPLLCRCPMVTVFHDLQYRRHPEYFRWFDLPFWRVLLPASAARSQCLVALSETVKADLMKYYGRRAADIEVIPHGVEPAFTRIARQREADPPSQVVLLTVSTLHPHKNLHALLRAFRAFLNDGRNGKQTSFAGSVTLRIIGLKGFEAAAIEVLRKELDLEQSVEIPGWLPREEVYRSFAEAHALIYPSKFEGFGIPVLEALTCGLPVACSRLPSLVEIAGECARYFDPEDADAMEEALRDVAWNEDLRKRLSEAGLARAQKFSREASARRLVELLSRVAQASTR